MLVKSLISDQTPLGKYLPVAHRWHGIFFADGWWKQRIKTVSLRSSS